MKGETKKREEAPQQTLQRLEGNLKAGELAALYILRGEERYFRERMAELVVAAAAARGLEVCRHDVKHPEFSLAKLCDDLRGNALFSPARCVLVHQISPLVTKNSREYSQAFVDLVLARIAQPAGAVLILSADSWSSEHAIVRTASSHGAFLASCRKLWETPPPWGAADASRIELVAWFQERARAVGLRLRPDEAHYVTQAVGNDLYALENELGRLRERGSKTVAEVVLWQAGASPYTIAEDLVRGDSRAAMRGIEALYQGGFQGRDGQRTRDEAGLATMLINALYAKLREAIAASSALERGASEKDAMVAAAIASSPRAQEALRLRLAARPRAAWRALLEEVAGLQRRAHTGRALDVNDFQHLALRWSVPLAQNSRARS